MPTYEHRQLSPWMFPVLAVIGFLLLHYGLGGPDASARLAAFAVAVAICVAFIQLSTRVDPRGVSWAFTLGVPGGAIAFEEIADVLVTRTQWWEGFGIHWSWLHGWLWNVSGFQGVMIRKRDGRLITLGTDDPQGLYDAIRAALRGATYEAAGSGEPTPHPL